MLFGEYYPSISDKNRTNLPKKIRENVAGIEIVLSKGLSVKCIFGFAKEEWEQTAKQELTKPLSDPEAQKIRRQLFGGTSIVELDEQGRFVIPDNLLAYAGINEHIVIVGAGDHFEVWDKKTYEANNE